MVQMPSFVRSGAGKIAGAVSHAGGNLTQQIKGVVAQQQAALSPTALASQAMRTADLATGGLVTAGKEFFGLAGDTGGIQAAVIGGRDIAPVYGELSQWGGLSKHLIASIYPCDDTGAEIMGQNNQSQGIMMPATEVQYEATLNWQSPFESAGPESKLPTIMAMIQSGQIGQLANVVGAAVGTDSKIGEMINKATGSIAGVSDSLKGKTGITKMNSRQVFAGMPPIRITMILHFRAVSDTETQVMEPYQKLLEWTMPQKLAESGVISEMVQAKGDVLSGMFPSDAPTMIGFRFANNRYAPMVIESVGNPLDGPMDSEGRPVYRAVQVTLATLTALDRADIANIFTRS